MRGGLQTLKEREIKLDDPSAAVIDVGFQDNPTYLPSELCHFVEGQRHGKKFSARQTTAMLPLLPRHPVIMLEPSPMRG